MLRRACLDVGRIERDKGDDVLDLKQLDLGDLAEALEDHSYEHSSWLDTETGEVVLWNDDFEEQGEPDPETLGLRAIDPIPSHEGYKDMEDFIQRVRNPQARHLLERAIAGRGAFRRFKDTLLDFPELREAWFRFHDTRVERRAIMWLVGEKPVHQGVAQPGFAGPPPPKPHYLSRRVRSPPHSRGAWQGPSGVVGRPTKPRP